MILTSHGLRFAAFTFFVAAMAWMFRDILLSVLAIVLSGVLTYELSSVLAVAKRLTDRVRLERDGVNLRMIAGKSEAADVGVDVDSGLTLMVESPLEWCSVEPGLVERGRHGLSWSFKPSLAGEYAVQELNARVFGRLGLVEAAGSLPFDLNVRVFPRVVVAIIRAARFLARAGIRGAGDQPIDLKGHGFEYAETRKYVAGDDLRYMDWKATARLGHLMVKTFYMDAGLAAHLVYDVRSSGPVSRDQLSTTFLNTALGLAQSELPFGLTIHEGDRTLIHVENAHPTVALRLAMKYVLHSMDVELEGIDVLLSPATSVEVRGMLMRLKDGSVKTFLEAESEALAEKTSEAYRLVLRLVHESEVPVRVAVLAEMVGDLTALIELSRAASGKGGDLVVLQPCRPWMEASTLEEAYELHERYQRAFRVLQLRRATVSTSLPPLLKV